MYYHKGWEMFEEWGKGENVIVKKRDRNLIMHHLKKLYPVAWGEDMKGYKRKSNI